MKVTILILAACLSFTIVGSRMVFADANLNCEAYGKAAVDQQQQNIQNKCGFGGGRWSNNYAGHVAWCKSSNVQMANLTHEDRARTKALEGCKSNTNNKILLIPGFQVTSDHTALCNRYADRAIELANKNKQDNCRLTGGRYANDRPGHFKWCMAQTREIVNSESKIREDQIAPCLNQAATAESCASYAKAAPTIIAEHASVCRQDNGNPSYEDLVAFCGRIGGPVNAINENKKLLAEIEHCKKFPPKVTKVFDKPGGTMRFKNGASKWLPFDVCNEKQTDSFFGGKSFIMCGQANANNFCKKKGYHIATDYKTYSVKNSDNTMSTVWIDTKKACHGNCGAFSTITCEKL